MLNILTNDVQENTKREYRLRLLIVFCLFFGVEVLAAVFGGALSFQALRGDETKFTGGGAPSKVEGFVASKTDAPHLVSETKARLVTLAAPRQEALSGALPLFASFRNGGVKITAFAATPLAEGGFEVSVSGTAETRDALAAFYAAAKSERRLAQVALPIDSFAKETALSFTLRTVYRETLP